ncbi:MAG: glycosyltransferase family 39 protein [Bacteroidota bacterium]|nr:glycosyltransferase family 39 protein [Bacteroidota bacterium]
MKKLHIVFIVILLSVPRFLFLEQDVPSYMIGGLSQEDEPYYCIGGVNNFLADEGRLHPDFSKTDIELLQIINTPTTYLSLKLFGSNYYGLRMPVVICSVFITLLLALFANKQGFPRWVILLTIVFLSTEFYSFLIGRFYNPQIFCMLFISLLLYIAFREKNNSKSSLFFVGFLCGFMVLGVYFYTLYIAVSVFLWYCLRAYLTKNFKMLVPLVFGGLAALLVWISYGFVFNINFNELFGNLQAHGGGIDADTSGDAISLPKKLILTLTQIISTNFFRYNLFLLVVFVVLVFYSIKTIRVNKYSQLFLIILSLFLLQNFFVQSYPFKKHVIFYPVIIIFTLANAKEIMKWLITNETKYLRIFLSVISLLFIYYNFKVNNSQQYWAGFDYGYYENIPKWLAIFGLIVAVVFLLALILPEYFFKHKVVATFLVILCILPSAYLVADQFFVMKTFFVRDALTEMKKEVSGKYVVQEFSHSFQFYSNAKPVLSNYDRPLIAKTNMKDLYQSTGAYAVVKSFRGSDKTKGWPEEENTLVDYYNFKFTVIKKYPLRFYDYYLLKFKE